MRILWSVNTVPARIAKEIGVSSSHAISWVDAMKDSINHIEGCSLSIVVPCKARGNCQKKIIDGITYYTIPAKGLQISSWKGIIKDSKPDIIHIYGTESTHNIGLIQGIKGIPLILSIQGIIGECAKYYYGGLSFREILLSYTIRDIVFRDGVIQQRHAFYKKAKYEKYVFESIKYVEGRSDWDKSIALAINPSIKYFYCPRMIRNPFFNYKWDIDNCHRHVLFTHQGSYPLKGFHFLLDALSIIVQKYPDVKLYVSGRDSYSRIGLKKRLSTPGYINLLRKRIKTYKLEKHVFFTGFLSAEELAKQLSFSHICIAPSVIENASNSIAEAMIVGVPIIASYVGGNAHMINNGECGLLYQYDMPEMLAARIDDYFQSDELCKAKSENAIKTAYERHNPEVLPKRLYDIYRSVVLDFNSQATINDND